ncbi:MAG TPA: hypothetical protein VM536_22795 [Chloroflexia bacterium]|nr:hypothetical protein [Chloroflexia bacterium]
MDTTFAQHWNLSIGLSLICLWVMWAFMTYDDIRAWKKGRLAKGVVVGCLCKTRHQEGKCPRDRDTD